MRGALLIAYYFPPIQAVGGFRTLRFAKYLPQFGWRPVVLSGSPVTAVEPIDLGLNDICPADLEVHRVGAPDPMRVSGKLVESVRRVVHFRQRETAASSTGKGAGSATSGGAVSSKGLGDSVIRRWYAQTVSNLFCTPDPKIWWALRAIPAALRLVQTEKPEILYTSGPPHSTHLVGLVLHQLTGVPWVADFRDPWGRCPWEDNAPAWRRWLDRKFERVCVRQAAAVVLNTDAAARDFAEYHSERPATDFAAIPNGYDPELREKIIEFKREARRSPRSEITRVIHAGEVYGHRSLRPIVEAMAILRRDGIEIELAQYGDCAETADLLQLANQLGLQGKVHVNASVPHREALSQMARSDILLAIQPGTALQIPSKIYEMMLFEKPILVVSDEGATSQLVKAHDLGVIAPCRDPTAIAAAIQRICTPGESVPGSKSVRNGVDDFDGRTLTGRLADVFSGIVAARDAKPVLMSENAGYN